MCSSDLRIRIEPLSPALGAEVSGVDLSGTLDDTLIAELRHAFLTHLVIFFRDQSLSPDRFLAFARSMGEPSEYPMVKGLDGYPEITEVIKKENERVNFGGVWHSDTTYLEKPPMGTMLLAREVPPVGGDTLFASMYAAYEALSETMKAFLGDLTAEHVSNYAGTYGDHKPQREFPHATHPVIRTHPVTGRKALFVNRGFTRRINGLAPKESTALLDFLFDHAASPAFQCRFQWEANSVAMWDNRCTQHLAIWDYFPETRSGLRVTVTGDRPT